MSEETMKCNSCGKTRNSDMFRAGRRQCKECEKFKRTLRIYGVSREDFKAMLKAQGNKCAICFTRFVDKPHLDHDHSTGQTRKLLCLNCNTAIGLMKEDPTIFLSAIEYLKSPFPELLGENSPEYQRQLRRELRNRKQARTRATATSWVPSETASDLQARHKAGESVESLLESSGLTPEVLERILSPGYDNNKE